MFKNLLNRFLQAVLVLFVLFTATFFLVKALPGGPFQSEKAIPQHIRARMEEQYGLKKSLPEQYVIMLKNFITGNPGVSTRLEGREVTEVVAQAFPVSLQLGLVAMFVAVTIGIPAGCLAAAKKNSLIDTGSMTVAMIGICLPSFVTGPLLAEYFGRNLHWFPAMGWSTVNPSTWILPAITLGLAYAAYISRLTRAGMLDTLSQDFVRTARAKGVPGLQIVFRHCLRGGLIPAVAYLGPAFAGIISGSVVIETVFQIPGLGRHFIKAIESRDAGMIMAPVLLFGSLVIAANFVTDLLTLWLNPRLRKSS
ncbi:ABC transporter permease [Luteolibacter sp. LG18]|uniref:ABC transporter permease n=1 Tax=Luteolibacter sp. LG18 TaxID=2819286 RepID=UPI002B2CEB67|nr:peptide ABC transporter permease [Luteolibacter sp. LG18]